VRTKHCQFGDGQPKIFFCCPELRKHPRHIKFRLSGSKWEALMCELGVT
jgi:hypothetical protein